MLIWWLDTPIRCMVNLPRAVTCVFLITVNVDGSMSSTRPRRRLIFPGDVTLPPREAHHHRSWMPPLSQLPRWCCTTSPQNPRFPPRGRPLQFPSVNDTAVALQPITFILQFYLKNKVSYSSKILFLKCKNTFPPHSPCQDKFSTQMPQPQNSGSY